MNEEIQETPIERARLRLRQCLRHRTGFINYMLDRMEDNDMHAVSVAANDVRELDAEIRTLKEMIK